MRFTTSQLGLLALCCTAACGDNLSAPSRDAVGGDAPAPLACVPNLDGRIDAEEVAPAIGVTVRYLVNPASEPREVDLAGAIDDRGRRVWDLATDWASDEVLTSAAIDPAGAWWRDDFAAADFAAPLVLAGRTLGVYAHDADAVRLLGVVSTEEEPREGQTLLTYTTPIVVWRVPLEPGAAWVSASDVRDAVVRGLPYAGRDVYEVAVVAAGVLELPDVGFDQALRVTTRLTITPAVGQAVQRRQSAFVFECFGEVARATSPDGEDEDDFPIAAELRRFGL
ncbi:MAG: hypothetical protein IT385_00685 [Deltaproteobacteria bacterium]|nr:hypothetical protein [Deltaproteobacteria bacterium]